MARKQNFILHFTPEYDFLLLGIFCAHRDYKLCFELNRHLPVDLVRIDDLSVPMEKRGSSSLFPVFFSLNEDEEEFYLVANKGSNGLFISELRQTDYFMVVRNPSRYTTVATLLAGIREIELVSSAIEVDPNELKSAENFLLLEPVSPSGNVSRPQVRKV